MGPSTSLRHWTFASSSAFIRRREREGVNAKLRVSRNPNDGSIIRVRLRRSFPARPPLRSWPWHSCGRGRRVRGNSHLALHRRQVAEGLRQLKRQKHHDDLAHDPPPSDADLRMMMPLPLPLLHSEVNLGGVEYLPGSKGHV